jgi:hypothetical protein
MIEFLIGLALLVGIVTLIGYFWTIWKPILKWSGIGIACLCLVAGAAYSVVAIQQQQQRPQEFTLEYLPPDEIFALPKGKEAIAVPENPFEQFDPLAKDGEMRWIMIKDKDGCFFRVKAASAAHADAIVQREGKALHPKGMFDHLTYGCRSD